MSEALLLMDHLQRQAVDQVAFYPLSRMEKALEWNEVEFSLENDELCGYLWHGPANPGRDLVIYQAVIDYSLRRRMHGAQLVARVIGIAEAGGSTGVRCRCRSDIEANEFWSSLGFSCISIKPSGIRRNTEVNTWRLPIIPGLWDHLSIEPSRKPKDRETYDILYRTNRDALPAKSRFAR